MNGMQNFQDTFETPKWSLINAFSVYMTVSLKQNQKIVIR